MKQDFTDFHASVGAHDDQPVNPSGNVPLQQAIDHRRQVLGNEGNAL